MTTLALAQPLTSEDLDAVDGRFLEQHGRDLLDKLRWLDNAMEGAAFSALWARRLDEAEKEYRLNARRHTLPPMTLKEADALLRAKLPKGVVVSMVDTRTWNSVAAQNTSTSRYTLFAMRDGQTFRRVDVTDLRRAVNELVAEWGN